MKETKQPIRFYSERDGMNHSTARQLVKRSKIGTVDPLTGWTLLSEAEWQAVLATRRPAGRPCREAV